MFGDCVEGRSPERNFRVSLLEQRVQMHLFDLLLERSSSIYVMTPGTYGYTDHRKREAFPRHVVSADVADPRQLARRAL